MNYAGLSESGEIIAYWWTPATKWNVSSLTANIPETQPRPTGTITNHVSDIGTMSVFGTADDGSVVRLWWTVAGNVWSLTDLSDVAVRA